MLRLKKCLYAAKTADLLHRMSENGNVRSLESRRYLARNRQAFLTGRTPSIGCCHIDSLHHQALETRCRHHWHDLLRNDSRTCYRAAKADAAVWERARRPKVCKLARNPALAQTVAVKWQGLWSPEPIAGWLKRTYSDQRELQVSLAAIYRTLFAQTRGALKKELLERLRRTRGMRHSRHYTQKTPIHAYQRTPSLHRRSCSSRPLGSDLLFGDA